MKHDARGISGGRVAVRGRRSGVAACLLALLALLACAGIGAPSASAADKVVVGSFGEIFGAAQAGPGGRLTSPGGIAVNQADGRIYIADANNNTNRVTLFSAGGAFERTWGKNVIASGPGDLGDVFEICVFGTGDVCDRATNPSAPRAGGVVAIPQGVAVDAVGNVYIADQANLRVQKFDPDGNFLLTFGKDVIIDGSDSDLDGITTVQVCEVAEHCKEGAAGNRGGEFASTFNGHLTIVPDGAAPNAGNLLVADPGNRRVQEFTPDGEFVRAFGWDVSASGPGQAGTPEVQTVTVKGTSGTFTLTFDGQTTTPLAFDASPESVEAALKALASTGGAASVSGGPADATGSTPYVVTLGGYDAPTMTVDTTDLGIPVGTVLTCAGGPTGGAGSTTVAYQWLADGSPATGSGATTASYTTDPTDAGKAIQCRVVATHTAGSAPTGSVQTSAARFVVSNALSPAPPLPPASITAPALPAGGFVANGTLTCADGTWAAGTNLAYQWYRNGLALTGNGAGTKTYTLQVADVATAAVFQCAVTGSNAGGAVTKVSANRVTAAPAPVPNPAAPVASATATSPLGSTAAETVKGVPAFEVCNDSANICKVGIEGSGVGQFATNTPARIAADSAGSIYTVEPTTNFRVQKFTVSSPGNEITPQGTFAEAHTKGTSSAGATQNNPLSVAVDPATQNVLVVKVFPAASIASCPGTGLPSVQERRIVEVSPSGATLEATHIACAGLNGINAIDVRGSTGDIIASTTGATGATPPNPAGYVLNLPLQDPSVSFNTITNITHNSAEVSGFVNPNGSNTSYRFRYKRSVDPTFTELSPVGAGKGTTAQLVSVKLPALTPGTSYDVQLVAIKAFVGSFATDVVSFSTAAAKAEVGIPSATTAIDPDTGEARAALYGKVNPNGKTTAYRFEYGTTASYGTKVPVPDASVGSGIADVPVARFVAGLEPDTTYHFRLVAKNVNGVAVSPDRTFTTPPLGAPGNCANEAIREQQGIAGIVPECRAYEIASPADKGASGMVADLLFAQQLWNQVSPDGSAVLYPIQNGIDESTVGGWTRWRANRVEGEGWLNSQVSAPAKHVAPRNALIAMPSYVLYASSDLSCAILYTTNPLTGEEPAASVAAGMENLYRWNGDDGTYTLLTDVVPANPSLSVGGNYYFQVEASEDCERIWFRTPYRFVPGVNDTAGEERGIYEWDEGVLRYAGELPDGTIGARLDGKDTVEGRAVVGGEVGEGGHAGHWNAASPEGDRFFFTAVSKESGEVGKPAIFMREIAADGDVTVTNISRSQTAVPTNGARFETATPAGDKVVFRANYGIAATTSPGPTNQRCGPVSASSGDARETLSGEGVALEPKPCDLYLYDVESGELTDLSADTNPADPAGAQIQGVVAIDADASHVYFAALGQLIPGKGRTYAQNTAGTQSANVYLWTDGELSYVTTLERLDLRSGSFAEGGASAALMRVATKWKAEASADGKRLVFESSSNLTGLDSDPVKAVYLFSADSGELACISCRVDGGPTLVGLDDTLLGAPRGVPLTDRPRRMSTDGSRVFFTSPDVLAPGARLGTLSKGFTTGKRNLYEWRDGRVSFLAFIRASGANGRGEYLGASADGKSVFLATMEQLVPEDRDFVSDVYAVRTGGGFLYDEPPPGCQVDEAISLVPNQIYCQGTAAAGPSALDPSSAGFKGSGNPAPEAEPAPGCSRGEVLRKGRCVAKRTLAKQACAKRKGKAKRRCIANQVRRLNRANANRGGAK